MTTSRSRLTDEITVALGFEQDARTAYDAALKRTKDPASKTAGKDFTTLNRAYQHLLECRAGVQRAVAAVEYHDQRQNRELSRKAREKHLRAELARQYGTLGMQYDMLVDRLVHLVLTAEDTEMGHVPLDLEEYRSVVYAVKALVDQLQKYTETTKTETLVKKRVETQVYKVLEIIERVIQPQSPVLWANALKSVEDEMPRLHEPVAALEA